MKKDRERFPPNNVLLVLAGAGLLWMGWAGFNGGDPYAANTDSSMAVLNTNICAATSFLVWTWLDVIFFEKPSVIGAVQGMITGLVCITPAAGTYYVSSQVDFFPQLSKVELYFYPSNLVKKDFDLQNNEIVCEKTPFSFPNFDPKK